MYHHCICLSISPEIRWLVGPLDQRLSLWVVYHQFWQARVPKKLRGTCVKCVHLQTPFLNDRVLHMLKKHTKAFIIGTVTTPKKWDARDSKVMFQTFRCWWIANANLFWTAFQLVPWPSTHECTVYRWYVLIWSHRGHFHCYVYWSINTSQEQTTWLCRNQIFSQVLWIQLCSLPSTQP